MSADGTMAKGARALVQKKEGVMGFQSAEATSASNFKGTRADQEQKQDLKQSGDAVVWGQPQGPPELVLDPTVEISTRRYFAG